MLNHGQTSTGALRRGLHSPAHPRCRIYGRPPKTAPAVICISALRRPCLAKAPLTRKIVFVGEQPGDQETYRAIPLSDPPAGCSTKPWWKPALRGTTSTSRMPSSISNGNRKANGASISAHRPGSRRVPTMARIGIERDTPPRSGVPRRDRRAVRLR